MLFMILQVNTSLCRTNQTQTLVQGYFRICVERNWHFIEGSQRTVKAIRERIKQYEKRNLDLVSRWPDGIPELVQKEIYDIDTKIRELKWTIYDD